MVVGMLFHGKIKIPFLFRRGRGETCTVLTYFRWGVFIREQVIIWIAPVLHGVKDRFGRFIFKDRTGKRVIIVQACLAGLDFGFGVV